MATDLTEFADAMKRASENLNRALNLSHDLAFSRHPDAPTWKEMARMHRGIIRAQKHLHTFNNKTIQEAIEEHEEHLSEMDARMDAQSY